MLLVMLMHSIPPMPLSPLVPALGIAYSLVIPYPTGTSTPWISVYILLASTPGLPGLGMDVLHIELGKELRLLAKGLPLGLTA